VYIDPEYLKESGFSKEEILNSANPRGQKFDKDGNPE
jgi:hypothetical protein